MAIPFYKTTSTFFVAKKKHKPRAQISTGIPCSNVAPSEPLRRRKKNTSPALNFQRGPPCSNAARSQPLLANPCADTTIRKKGKTFRKRQKVFFCISTNGDTVLQNHFTFFLWRGKKHKPRAQISTGMRVMCVELLAS